MAEATALLSLSRTQRRLAREYKKWALEDEAAGRLERYRKYRREAERLWREAAIHFQHYQERRAHG